MLVKSFTDDLAWDVQHQLVNTYFKVEKKKADDTLKTQIQQERARAMLLNAQYRMLKLLMDKPEMQKLSPVAVETLQIKAVESITGAGLGDYLPQVTKTYSATEIANALGTTANKVGKIANDYGLKTDEYGITVIASISLLATLSLSITKSWVIVLRKLSHKPSGSTQD